LGSVEELNELPVAWHRLQPHGDEHHPLAAEDHDRIHQPRLELLDHARCMTVRDMLTALQALPGTPNCWRSRRDARTTASARSMIT
jgi:hypothetical protein